MAVVKQSEKLKNVLYDIRGPVLEQAERMEAEGHRILKLNIGNPATDSLSPGVRVLDAILSAAACRNAGWQPIPISSLVPAAQ